MENPFFLAIIGDMSLGQTAKGLADAFEEQGYPVQRIDITPFEGSNQKSALELKDLIHNSIDLIFVVQSTIIYDLNGISIPWVYYVLDITHICWPKYSTDNPAKQFYYSFYGAPDIYKNSFIEEMEACHHDFLPLAINPKEWSRDLLYTKWMERQFDFSFIGNHIHEINTNPFLISEPRQSNLHYNGLLVRLHIFDPKYPQLESKFKRDECLIESWEQNIEPTIKDISFMEYQWYLFNSKFIFSIPQNHNLYDQITLDCMAAGCILLQYSTIINGQFQILKQLGLNHNNNCYLFNATMKLDYLFRNKSENRQAGIELVYNQHTYLERFNQIISTLQHIVENREENLSCALL